MAWPLREPLGPVFEPAPLDPSELEPDSMDPEQPDPQQSDHTGNSAGAGQYFAWDGGFDSAGGIGNLGGNGGWPEHGDPGPPPRPGSGFAHDPEVIRVFTGADAERLVEWAGTMLSSSAESPPVLVQDSSGELYIVSLRLGP
jgi:hypothetical protein